MRLLTIDRSPMVGESGRVYRVLGEDDVPVHRLRTILSESIVSVASPNNYNADWGGNLNVLPALFWDVCAESESRWMRCLDAECADRIARHVERKGVSALTFQCEAGVSRSAGLCVAVARHFGDEGVARECYERYAPNELVVERMAEAFGRQAGRSG